MSTTFRLVDLLTTDRQQGTIIWLFNIGAEKHWNPVSTGIIDRSEDIIVNRMEEMNLLLCREQDVMILREEPDIAFLDMLRAVGFQIPTILVPESADPYTPIAELVMKDEVLKQKLRRIGALADSVYFVPYAVTRLEEQLAAECGFVIPLAASSIQAQVNDKIVNRRMAETLGFPVCEGKVCRSTEEIQAEYARLTEELGFTQVIIKEPHGASGKGLYLVEREDQLSSICMRLGRSLRKQPDSRWLVEGWYRKKADISYQLSISSDGTVDVFSIKEQVLRDTVYIGSRMPALIRAEAHADYQRYGEQIGTYLFEELGYIGVVGVDSIITDQDVIIPIIEINGRFTLSTYISFVQHVLGHRSMFARYFKVVTDAPYTYGELCRMLKEEGLLYSSESEEGVLLYTAGTLPFAGRSGEADGMGITYNGRLFCLMVAQDWERVERMNTQLEAWISTMSGRSLVV
jgi:phosphoribosylaminoimidazole carboxylase (NCAIR synthetase)